MKSRRIPGILTAVVLLACAIPAAMADGGSYAAPVNIAAFSVMPTNWETALTYKGQPMTWGVENLLDGRWGTTMTHTGWNNEALDDTPDITFYFRGTSLSDMWIRNGFQSDTYTDYARIMILDVKVWDGDELLEEKRFKLQDSVDDTQLSPDWIDGYQRMALRKKHDYVTRVELFIRGWYQGTGKNRYVMQTADLLFMPSTLEEMFGPAIYDGSYVPSYPTWNPTALPTITPAPAVTATPVPENGIQVLTSDRLATRSGPGTDYTETGSYFKAGTWVKALSSAYDGKNGIWWVQVELNYAGELRRVYTGVKRLNMNADMVPVESALGTGVLSRSVYAYWGPGYGYSMYDAQIPAGTYGTVYAQEGYYVQFEFYDSTQKTNRRVWVPMNAVEQGNEGNG